MHREFHNHTCVNDIYIKMLEDEIMDTGKSESYIIIYILAIVCDLYENLVVVGSYK